MGMAKNRRIRNSDRIGESFINTGHRDSEAGGMEGYCITIAASQALHRQGHI